MLTSITGINWGDEGKGRMVDLLSQDYDIVARYQGGDNAGHTVKTERETAERDALRKEYLADMRASFKQQLDATYVQTADGAKIPYAEYAKLNRK